MIKLCFQKFNLINLCFTIIVISACGNDDGGVIEPPIEQFTVGTITVEDVGNNQNAADILVSFARPIAGEQVKQYKIVVIAANATSLDVEAINALPSDRFLLVTDTNPKVQVNLLPSQLDINGNSIEKGKDYVILILTIGSFNEQEVLALSNPSSVFKLTATPLVYTLAKNLDANDALSIDLEGNIYVSNYGNYDNSIGKGDGSNALKITAEGEVTNFVSNLSSPVGNAIDNEGNFYVNNDNDFTSGDLLKVSENGTRSIIATIEGYPAGVLRGTNGNFFVSNYSKPVVHEVTAAGEVSTFASDQRLVGGVGIAYDDDGNIIVGNSITGDILSISEEGVVTLIATIPTVVAQSVIGYITYFDNYVYATGIGSNIIYRVALTGEVIAFAGNGLAASKDGEFGAASFAHPNGITVDKTRKLLYISEAGVNGDAALRVIPLQSPE